MTRGLRVAIGVHRHVKSRRTALAVGLVLSALSGMAVPQCQSAAFADTLLNPAQGPSASNARFPFLKSWVGRYPIETKLDKNGNLIGRPKVVWNNPALKNSLIDVIGEERFKTVTKTSDRISLIKQHDNWILLSLASRFGEFAISLIYVNFATGEIGACLQNDEADISIWLTNLQPTAESKKSGTRVDTCIPRWPPDQDDSDFGPLMAYGSVKLSDDATGKTRR